MDRDLLLSRKGEIRALADRHGALALSVFGSVATGTAGPDSDVDLLVDFPAAPSFEQFMDLKLALEDLLHRPVDLVTRSGLRPELRHRIEAEAVLVA
jgi:uncharacterized protein